jgi:NADPH:quinone reductase
VVLAQRLGADAVVNGRNSDAAAAARDFASGGLDAALLTAGGDAADRSLASVRDGGRAAFPNGVMPEPKIPSGVRQDTYNVTANREAIEKLKQLIEVGPFEVHVARTFPLGNAAEAHRALSQHYLGKLALRVSA